MEDLKTSERCVHKSSSFSISSLLWRRDGMVHESHSPSQKHPGKSSQDEKCDSEVKRELPTQGATVETKDTSGKRDGNKAESKERKLRRRTTSGSRAKLALKRGGGGGGGGRLMSSSTATSVTLAAASSFYWPVPPFLPLQTPVRSSLGAGNYLSAHPRFSNHAASVVTQRSRLSRATPADVDRFVQAHHQEMSYIGVSCAQSRRHQIGAACAAFSTSIPACTLPLSDPCPFNMISGQASYFYSHKIPCAATCSPCQDEFTTSRTSPGHFLSKAGHSDFGGCCNDFPNYCPQISPTAPSSWNIEK
ncbi:hypothetical protein JOB18_002012 [Solea senegalensis]|uniref:Uncharacterized protein n=1 Tax=Solea senegalensis TaxID=28829 RepID=A0AAV6PU96_SOLSE|nr:hypothetical protein JOB18_002012 [Solea senegalensis]